MPPRHRPSLPLPARLRSVMAEGDYERAGLLDGLTGDDRRTRISVLESLAADGVAFDTMRDAIARDRLGLLLLERTLRPDDGHSLTDVCRLADVDLDVVRRWFQALGRPLAPDPDDPIYTDEDVEIAERIHRYRSLGFSDEEMMPVVRAIGRGVLNIADALGGLLGEALLSPGEPEPEMALRYATEARRIVEEDSLHLVHLVAAALADRIRSHALAVEETSAGRLQGAQDVTVCFADLVGFTDLGESVSAVELSEVAEMLSACATEVVTSPVRLAKVIGDAVMLVSPDPTALVHAAVALVEAWSDADDGRPALRVGAAKGIGVPHAGDWFGPPVNLASRVTETARPGEVTVTAAVHDAVLAATPEGVEPIRFRTAAPRKFKGVRGAQRLYRVQRRSSGASATARAPIR
ncbi:adenylate/guanylate cyclase domain-containing protein [Actinomycetospora lemnae]|uniref:Adenylate cyclase regulatory domain-containing protein n=1 Tax=Actinomycetospora lemnae TaxID=3019891 RepID=A0ABT5SWI7_9PSEU|nr:adenylate/guanylate cyclase domain-containing protein [Actinomycetospora sp. DW7H6]MDD7967129.1 adenylate cyclase regulatory domain-containing protein [Actinomycetospora sp. DW7H6]